MTSEPERRKSERFEHAAPIVFTLRGSDQFVDARLCNFCRRGMAFITGDPIAPGTEIYIMTEHYSPDTIGAEIYDGFLGRVLWCKPQPDSPEGDFRIGVQYSLTTIK